MPKQKHPLHCHIKKEETFQVLYGDLILNLEGKEKLLKQGDMQTIESNMNHSFLSDNGCIFEEISTTHYPNDSFYRDEKIINNKNRKTYMTFWIDWLYENIK